MDEYYDKKPKLLILVTQADFGGAQRYALDMATGLRDEWEVLVGTGHVEKGFIPFGVTVPEGTSPSSTRGVQGEELLDRAAALGLPTKIFDHLRRAINPWHDLLAVFELAGYFRKDRPDAVLANSSKAEVVSALAGLLIKCFGRRRLQPASPSPAKAGGYPRRPRLVATIHGFAFLEPVGLLRKILYFKFQWLAGRLRHATIVLSEYEKAVALRYRIARPESLHVIPHGIGPINFLDRETARGRLGLPKEKTIVGTIANLYATKGLDVLVNACGFLPSGEGRLGGVTQAVSTPPLAPPPRGGEILVTVIGEGPERPRLEQLIAKQGSIGLIRLMGPIKNAAQYLKAFDLFVLPSRKEGLPYTLLEAMAAGLPIVATRVGAVPEVLKDYKNATLVAPEDPRALAVAIRSRLGQPIEPVGPTTYALADEIKNTNGILRNFIAR